MTWRDWRVGWLALRNRLISSPRFQIWAAGFLLTRPIARRHARSLFDLTAGFVYSQILLACQQLKLFDLLAEGPQSADALAARIALPTDATRRLLLAAVALGLFERLDEDDFALGVLGAALRGNPGLNSMIEHHAVLYEDLRDPVALLRGLEQRPALSRFWPYAGHDDPASLKPSDVQAYSRLMADSQGFVAEQVLTAHSFNNHRRICDIGGGEGVFLIAVGKRAPNIELTVFDLPAVVTRAAERIESAGLASRARVVGGNMFSDPLPKNNDVMTLIRVLHDHNDDAVVSLLKCAHAALDAGGTILIAEPMAGTRNCEAVGDAYFGFYLAAMGSGRARTAEEFSDLLRSAGFVDVRRVRTRTPLIVQIITARVPQTS